MQASTQRTAFNLFYQRAFYPLNLNTGFLEVFSLYYMLNANIELLTFELIQNDEKN